jgi:hypothetical protein
MMDQNAINPATRELAARLIAFEGALNNSEGEDAASTCQVCEKLRRPLGTLAGTAGFASLLARALALARREAPVLDEVQVQSDGSLLGFTGKAAETSPVLVAHLLNLLTTFIGEALLLQLLSDVWPDLPASEVTSLRKEPK